MDPMSIVGLIGSIVSIADVVSKSITKLSQLKNTYHNAPLQVTMLIGQLHLIRAALDELEKWKRRDLDDNERYRQLAGQIETSMTCFSPLIESLQQYLDKLDDSLQSEPHAPKRQDKLLFMWNDSDIAMYLTLADRQINALNLLLQAIQCNTWAEQRNTIEREQSQTIIKLARDCTSSLLCLNDGLSFVSENTNAISLQFEFDSVVLGSLPYQTAFRSHLLQTIRTNRPVDNLSTIANFIMNNDAENQVETAQLQEDEAEDSPHSRASFANASVSDSSPELMVVLRQDDEGEKWRPASASEDIPMTRASPTLSRNKQSSSSMQTSILRSVHNRIRQSRDQRRESQSRIESEIMQNYPDSILITKTVDVGQEFPPVAIVREPINKDDIAFEAARAASFPGRQKTNDQSERRNVLLLGTGMSGKTTIVKSLLPIVYGFDDASRAELPEWGSVIVKNVIRNMESILDIMEELEIAFRDWTAHGCALVVLAAESTGQYEPLKLVNAIKTLWADLGFKEAFQRHLRPTLEWDNLVNLIDDVDRLLQPGSVPNQQDICKAWVRTTGIHRKIFRVRGTEINLYDVGGQRSERRKWVHCFDNVSVLMFVADSTAYAKTTLEDNDLQGHIEQLNLFEAIANREWFAESKIVLVLTKIDLLDDILQRRPPTDEEFSTWETSTKEHFLMSTEIQFSRLIRDPEKRRALRVIRTDVVHDEADARKILDLMAGD